ncbi:MAG: hypothetical protein E7617_03765 [Ruminococcaceae bacterium]|nr:hypothetical protein [Oscillospiraceae bacterium]
MKKGQKRYLVVISLLLISVTVIGIISGMFIFSFAKNNVDLEYDERLFRMAGGSSTTDYYSNASGIASLEYTPALWESISLGEQRRLWIDIDELPEHLLSGFLAVEDREFYSHSGVNVRRSMYALANRFLKFRSTFGASTITQQVVKNISGDAELTLKRKLSEMIRAHNIEKRHTKREILELYVNIIPMGEGIYGVNAAAEHYFGKEPLALTIAESAVLIGITNAPTRYNPHKNPEVCLEKRNTVLDAMLDFGVISEEEHRTAISDPLSVIARSDSEAYTVSWFIETVNRDVVDALCREYSLSRAAAEALLYNGGLRVYTTANSEIQSYLEDYFEDESNFPNMGGRSPDFSMVICDSRSGDLVALAGASGKKDKNKLLNLALTPRAPGSALKPLALYAPLIDKGRINWATVFDDVPLEFIESGDSYSPYPKNYPSRYDGLTTVSDALRLSKNTVAMRLYGMLGADEIYRSLKRDYGFDTLVRKDYRPDGSMITDLAAAPLALGQLSYGVSLRKLTEAYTVFPSEGIKHSARSFVRVLDKEGNVLLENGKEEKQIMSAECARVMNQLLSLVTESGTASAVRLKEIVDTAGKTGTSGDDKDRLFIGYTPYLTAGIWCGYRDSGKGVGRINPTHIEIWDKVMTDIHKNELLRDYREMPKSFSTEGLRLLSYCRDSGKLYMPDCMHDPRGTRLAAGYFIPGNTPKGECDRHVLVRYDGLTEGIATDACPEEYVILVSLLDIKRSFPIEITVTDAEYVCMDIDESLPRPEDYEKPYFYPYIEDGVYVGKGRKKKQYNSSCYLHDE